MGCLSPVPRVESFYGFIFVSFDPQVVDLETYLAGAAPYLAAVTQWAPDGMEVIEGSQSYGARANWKLMVENNIDAYHLPSLHPTYIRYLKETGADVSPGVTGKVFDLGTAMASR